MSNRERCIEILNSFSDAQLGNIAAMLQAARDAIAEAADDAYCARLYEEYLADEDAGETVSFEEALQELGVEL